MACLSPLIAVKAINKDGVVAPKILGKCKDKSDIEFYRVQFGDSLVMLPCGKCVNCVKDYSRLWQARIMCESIYHKSSFFITLTYANNSPEKPLKSHLRHFIKDCRNSFGSGLKFFGCGEVGDKGRSHYHLILFGITLNDLVPISKRGLNILYTSPTIEKLWDKGLVSVGDLDIQSAGYVAMYSQKKRLEGLEKDSSWIIMSRGLGLKYVMDHKDELLKSDYIYIKGNRFKLPRYFLDKLDKYCSNEVEVYKKRKQIVATSFRYNAGYSLNENNARRINKTIQENKARKEVLQRELDRNSEGV